MLIYDFLKDNKAVNVQFSASKGIIHFVPPVENSRWCMKKREDFSELYGELVTEYMDFHCVDVVYTVLYIDRYNDEFADIIKFYTDWNECCAELRGHSNMPRKCVREETVPFILNFMQKDFSAERIERSWYFGDKQREEQNKKLIQLQKENPAAALVESKGGQLTIPVITNNNEIKIPEELPKKTKKELLNEEIARKCRENGLDPADLPPWQNVDEFIKSKKDKPELVTVHITLKKEDLDRILAEFDVKLIGGINGEATTEVPMYDHNSMASFFDELDKTQKPKKKRTKKTADGVTVKKVRRKKAAKESEPEKREECLQDTK